MSNTYDEYPSLSGEVVFSVGEWRALSEEEKTEFIDGFCGESFYVCGRYLPEDGHLGFRLWTQQGEWRLEGKPEWIGPSGQSGDWVAMALKPQGASVSRPRLRRLVPGGENKNLREPQDSERLRLRRHFVEEVKALLQKLGMEEVETPYIVPCPGMEPTLEPFALEWKWGSERKTFYLPTSPELHLKKMLAQGWTDIFEIKTCFRNSELSATHEPEFLMLEWYRAFKDLERIKTDLASLLDGLYEADLVVGERPRLSESTYSDLFVEFLNFKLLPSTGREELMELCRREKVDFSDDDSWDDLFFRLSLDKIEPFLADKGPLIIKDFPPSQAALARKTSKGWADRFEFYWRGLEIANAFHELNDPHEQAQRFHEDALKRQALKTSPLEPDADFLEHLRWGMPPAAGVALGVERLLMACRKENELKKFRAFSFY